MKVPAGVLQVGLAIRKKYKADASELKTVDDIRNQRREALKQVESVDDILAAEAKQAQRRKPATTGKVRRAKSPGRPVEDNPWHRTELVTTVTEQPPEPVTTVTEQPPEPLVYVGPDPDLHPASGVWIKPRPFGDTPPRDVLRQALVAFAVDVIRQEGPQSTNALLDRAFPGISDDDRSALRQRLPKWLIAEFRDHNPPLSGRRYRAKEGNEKRENLFGFWPEPRQGKSREAVNVAEVLTAIAELKTELVTLRQVQSELLQRQNLLKEGFAAMLEKLTWNGEI